MYSDEDFEWFEKEMRSTDDTNNLALTLKTCADRPGADPRVLAHLQRFLDDYRPCLVMIPYHFGEIRWLAVRAIVAERRALEMNEPFRIKKLRRPLDTTGVSRLAERHGITSTAKDFLPEMIDLYGQLAARDLVPVDELVELKD